MVDHCSSRPYAKRTRETERAHRFGIFLEGAKMLTARTCFGECREAWWTIAPRKPMQSGGRDRTSPPLWNFFGCRKNVDAPHVLWKMRPYGREKKNQGCVDGGAGATAVEPPPCCEQRAGWPERAALTEKNTLLFNFNGRHGLSTPS